MNDTNSTMNDTNIAELPELKALTEPKRKVTLIVLGGGMMGCDVKKEIVIRAVTTQHGCPVLVYSEPRGRKLYVLDNILRGGAIVLAGHRAGERPIFEGDVAVDGVRSMILDGRGGRFVDADGDDGKALIEWLRTHALLHTLTARHTIELLQAKRPDSTERLPGDPKFKMNLLTALGPPAPVGSPEPFRPQRKELLTPKMKEELQARVGSDPVHPLYKLFMPEGVGTWVLFSMEPDGDTLWAACDIGQGLVEYGTVSLRELETTVGPVFKLPMERDIHFDGKRYTLKALLDKETLSGI